MVGQEAIPDLGLIDNGEDSPAVYSEAGEERSLKGRSAIKHVCISMKNVRDSLETAASIPCHAKQL